MKNDSSKQEQVGTQILCLNGGEFEQKVQHMLKGAILLKELQQIMLEPCV